MLAFWQCGVHLLFLALINAKEKLLKLSELKEYNRLNAAGQAGLKLSELFRGNIRKGACRFGQTPDGVK
jgi:hypothetical protein